MRDTEHIGNITISWKPRSWSGQLVRTQSIIMRVQPEDGWNAPAEVVTATRLHNRKIGDPRIGRDVNCEDWLCIKGDRDRLKTFFVQRREFEDAVAKVVDGALNIAFCHDDQDEKIYLLRAMEQHDDFGGYLLLSKPASTEITADHARGLLWQRGHTFSGDSGVIEISRRGMLELQQALQRLREREQEEQVSAQPEASVLAF